MSEPFSWVQPIHTLWARGDRLQAAFWYYVYQLRSRPWADADRNGGGAAALRASVAAGLGREINEWIGSDPAAWRDTGARAIAYEKTLSLYSGRPDGVSQDDWLEANHKARQAYEEGFNQMWAEYSPSDIEAQRRQRGLYVGPLKNPGQPLRW